MIPAAGHVLQLTWKLWKSWALTEVWKKKLVVTMAISFFSRLLIQDGDPACEDVVSEESLRKEVQGRDSSYHLRYKFVTPALSDWPL